ncbi:hypothetical protein AMAG_06257 [Allomyces macrogynus ATCC 38327]|uniref:RGS domain-containing protein n=1 Tax=Allomyces macrogynus (strain ATCC 38327) TaxID=578462 RepID=A0A0L0SG56_ALLM3|nr:hypothetical protein AMAG_06257 [Allomyces macrogynus ATCC 38327]|eukprot:KNE61429.1 hypothetical protein AMAG_06257 [Allomyces macrogynus ATCC 38327]
MILHPPPSADQAPTVLRADTISFHDASRSMATRTQQQLDRSSTRGTTMTLTHEQLVGTIVWNVFDLFFLALFLYLAYVRKVEFLERRYPLLVAVQAVANCLWANAFLQSPSAIKWLPQGPDGPLGGSVPRFFLATATCPLWFASCTMRACSVIADHFANVQMLHDTSKCCAIWTDHLTPTERRFLTALEWLLGTRPTAHATMSMASTDSDPIWPASATTASPSAALLADGSTVPARTQSASALAMRRIATRVQLKALFGAAAFGLLVLVPAGMAASHCFSDPAVVPTAMPYPECLHNPLYSSKKYMPLVGMLLTFIAVLPLLFVLMRGIPDTHYLRLEIMSQFVALDLLVVGYLLVGTVFAKTAPPIIAESSLVLLSLIEAMVHALVIPTVYCLWKGWSETRLVRIGCSTRLAVGKSSLNTVHLELSSESLKLILQDETLFAKFKESLSRSFCLENGLFWHDLARIESLTPSSRTPSSSCAATVLLHAPPPGPGSSPPPPGSPPSGAPTSRAPTLISAHDAATRRALYQLYVTYVAPDAPRELNLSSHAREMVAAEARAGTLRVASFASVKDEVFQAMYTNSLPRFLAELEREQASAADARRGSSAVEAAPGDGEEGRREGGWGWWTKRRG